MNTKITKIERKSGISQKTGREWKNTILHCLNEDMSVEQLHIDDNLLSMTNTSDTDLLNNMYEFTAYRLYNNNYRTVTALRKVS